jgi:hypothetical protein
MKFNINFKVFQVLKIKIENVEGYKYKLRLTNYVYIVKY